MIPIVPGQEISIEPEVEFYNVVTNITIFHTYLPDVHQSMCNNVKIMLKYMYEYSPTGMVKVSSLLGQVCSLTVQTDGILGIVVNVTMTVLHCPPGFEFDNCTNQCFCAISKYEAFSRCNSTSMQASIKEGYWAGYIPQTNNSHLDSLDLYVSPCPPGYCVYISTDSDVQGESSKSYAREHNLPIFSNQSTLDEFMCGLHRTGQLCGDFQLNHSVGYRSRNYTGVFLTLKLENMVLYYTFYQIFYLSLFYLLLY